MAAYLVRRADNEMDVCVSVVGQPVRESEIIKPRKPIASSRFWGGERERERGAGVEVIGY